MPAERGSKLTACRKDSQTIKVALSLSLCFVSSVGGLVIPRPEMDGPPGEQLTLAGGVLFWF